MVFRHLDRYVVQNRDNEDNVDINLMGIFGGERCRLQKRRPLRVFD